VRAKPVLLRRLAAIDVDAAIDYYAREAGAAVALRFVGALERAYERIGRAPAIGSLRYAQELSLPGIRIRRVAGFPYLIFYVEKAEAVEVWRVLHARRDIPAWLQESSDP
jgi:toxin ParE1/3/4